VEEKNRTEVNKNESDSASQGSLRMLTHLFWNGKKTVRLALGVGQIGRWVGRGQIGTLKDGPTTLRASGHANCVEIATGRGRVCRQSQMRVEPGPKRESVRLPTGDGLDERTVGRGASLMDGP